MYLRVFKQYIVFCLFVCFSVTVDVAMRVKKETVTGGTNTKNLKEAKKGRRPAVSPPPSRRAPRRHPQSRRGRGLVSAAVPELDIVNLVIFLDNV